MDPGLRAVYRLPRQPVPSRDALQVVCHDHVLHDPGVSGIQPTLPSVRVLTCSHVADALALVMVIAPDAAVSLQGIDVIQERSVGTRTCLQGVRDDDIPLTPRVHRVGKTARVVHRVAGKGHRARVPRPRSQPQRAVVPFPGAQRAVHEEGEVEAAGFHSAI